MLNFITNLLMIKIISFHNLSLYKIFIITICDYRILQRIRFLYNYYFNYLYIISAISYSTTYNKNSYSHSILIVLYNL